jgi:phage shock protein A
VNKYEEANRKKQLLIAKQKRAEAQKKVANTMSSISDNDAFSHFSRMEEKVNQISAEADAATALNASMEGGDLEAKFKELEKGTSSVDDELAALKTKLNKK